MVGQAARQTPDGVVLYESDGLVATASLGAVRVRIRPVASCNQTFAMATALHRLVEMTQRQHNWVVDVSELKELPLALVSALVALEQKLRSRQGRLEVIGVCPGMLSPPTREDWLEVFHFDREPRTSSQP